MKTPNRKSCWPSIHKMKYFSDFLLVEKKRNANTNNVCLTLKSLIWTDNLWIKLFGLLGYFFFIILVKDHFQCGISNNYRIEKKNKVKQQHMCNFKKSNIFRYFRILWTISAKRFLTTETENLRSIRILLFFIILFFSTSIS